MALESRSTSRTPAAVLGALMTPATWFCSTLATRRSQSMCLHSRACNSLGRRPVANQNWSMGRSSGRQASTLPNLRFPRLNGGKFALDDKKNKLAGYELFIEYGLGDERSNMVFDCCKVVKRVIETKEGGTVHLTWQVQYSGDRLDQETCGKLALLEQDLIAIRLIPPVVAVEEPDDEGPENSFGDERPKEEPAPTAEDLFIGGAAEPEDEFAEVAALESDAR